VEENMANWSGVNQAMESGFNMGQKTGGKMSGIGLALKSVADKLRSERETGEALNLLGRTEQVKAMYNPQEWKPKTKEEALAYEKSKQELKPQQEAIVDKQGNVVGYRPTGSVFQPSATTEEIIATLGNGGLPGIKATPSTNPTIKANVPSTDTGRVMVVSPDGKKGSIPKEQLQEALANGYKRTL